MSRENMNGVLNPSIAKSLSPVGVNYTNQTTITGTMTEAQVDREQGIKVLAICAGTAAVLGGLFMICKAFGGND